MQSYCIRVGPKSNMMCPYKKREIYTQTHRGDGQVKTEAETAVMNYKPRNIKDCPQLPQAWRGRKGPSLTPVRESMGTPTP